MSIQRESRLLSLQLRTLSQELPALIGIHLFQFCEGDSSGFLSNERITS